MHHYNKVLKNAEGHLRNWEIWEITASAYACGGTQSSKFNLPNNEIGTLKSKGSKVWKEYNSLDKDQIDHAQNPIN